MTPVSNPNRFPKKEKVVKKQAAKSGNSENPLSHFFNNKNTGSPSSSSVKGKSVVIADPKPVTTVEDSPIFISEESAPLETEVGLNPVVNSPRSLEKSPSTSSLESVNSKSAEGEYFQVHTNLFVVEKILADLYNRGEENLALLLAQFYKASYFPKSSESDPLLVGSINTPPATPSRAESSSTVVAPSTPIQTSVSLSFISPTIVVPLFTVVDSTVVSSSVITNPIITMAGVGGAAPLTRMEQILANRYAPLVLHHPLSQMPTGDYQKYMPKFLGTGDYTAEEHLEAFYAYAENINIEAEDVWTRIFVQSLDGEAQNWFKTLLAGSIVDITALDDVFLKH